MREQYSYLNDEDLEALIADVEKSGMIAPPVYLKELIMEGAVWEEKAVKESLEAERGEEAAAQCRKAEGKEKALEAEWGEKSAMQRRWERGEKAIGEKRESRRNLCTVNGSRIKVRENMVQRARIRFWIYSFKIAAAAAVAVFCLTAIPMDAAGEGVSEASHMEERIERDIERYQQEKEKALADEGGTGLRNLLNGRLRFGSGKDADGIFDGFVNWFGMEE